MYERRNQIRTKLIVTFIRLEAAATAGALLIDPTVVSALVSDPSGFLRTRGILQEDLHTIQQRLGVRDAYLFDRDRRVLATTDTLGMQVGEVAAGLDNYAPEIERVFEGEAVVTVPFQDEAGNV